MIEQFVRTLLQPLYNAMGYLIPILIILVSGIVIFIFVNQLKMHIGKKRESKNMSSFVPYMSEEEINYVFDGTKKKIH